MGELHRLEYRTPKPRTRRLRLPRIPPNQSWAGTFAYVCALLLIIATAMCMASLFVHLYPAAGVACCATFPLSLLVVLFAILGLAEGERDGTLARWSLWTTGACWMVIIAAWAVMRWR